MAKTVSIQWGGFYTSQQEGGRYGVFRLLDFTNEAYHAAIFREKFTTQPTWSDVQNLRPLIGHAPISSLQFYHEEIKLIGSVPLKADELEGYEIYLDNLQYTRDEIEEIRGNLLNNSQLGPLMVILSIVDGTLKVQTVSETE